MPLSRETLRSRIQDPDWRVSEHELLQPNGKSAIVRRQDMADEFYDPGAWLARWPHEEKPVWDVWSKVHTRFGVAAQKGTELETGLVMLVAQMEQAQGREPQLETLLVGLAKSGARCLGLLISTFGQLYTVPNDDILMQELARAKEARNYLIHHFYRDRAELFTSPEGCEKLVGILVSIYRDLDAALQQLKDWYVGHLGYSPDEEVWDRINEDVAKWRDENQQMLDACLGKRERRA